MEDIVLLDAIERYLSGQMNEQEKEYFENLRNTNARIDQMVVEHDLFTHQMDNYAGTLALKQKLQQTHDKLSETGFIKDTEAPKSKVIVLFNKYKRVAAIAACVAGIIALGTSVIVSQLPDKNDKMISVLANEVEYVKRNQQNQNNKLNEVVSKIPSNVTFTTNGTGFLIDAKGYIVTNAHVVKGNSTIVINNKGKEFYAEIVHRDFKKDLAILKIKDKDFKSPSGLPYNLRNTNTDLGDEVFTLGYPKNDIVYNMGYTSSRSGYNGDTSTFQLSISANHGNSGAPVLNKRGDVIGIISSSQNNAEGVVFAIKTKNIYRMIDELKKSDTSVTKIKPISSSSLNGLNRQEQIAKMEECVFMVKAYNK